MHCRHCGKEIERTGNGTWTDLEGFAGCIKGGLWRDPITDEVHRRPAVEHLPLPS